MEPVQDSVFLLRQNLLQNPANPLDGLRHLLNMLRVDFRLIKTILNRSQGIANVVVGFRDCLESCLVRDSPLTSSIEHPKRHSADTERA